MKLLGRCSGSIAVAIGGMLAVGGSTFGQVGEGWVDVSVRDSDSGRGIAARLNLTTVHPGRRSLTLPASGKVRVGLSAGQRSVEVAAGGYTTLRTHVLVKRDETLEVTLWLDPLTVPDRCKRDYVASRAGPGDMMLHGHVLDAAKRAPLSRAFVRVDPFGVVVRTDSEGWFEAHMPVPIRGSGDPPLVCDLVVEAPGYAARLARGLPVVEGNTHLILDLQPGNEDQVEEHDARHKLSRANDDPARQPIVEPARLAAAESFGERSHVRFPGDTSPRAASMVWTPPTSIRVGFDCSCRDCATVQVLTLETYVKRGLNDEWIASWLQHSLRAGAVPYRSYGVWHVANPIDANYDICSTTCCQVNDADTSAGTDQAAERTTGILLESAGAILRSEYSAENNAWDDPNDGLSCSNADLSCGNGNAGSPSTGWPCLADSPGVGHGCFGHGRGMCQWGTQRWAGAGSLWNWTVDHYYNDNDNPSGLRSAYMTSPLDIVAVTADPAGLEAGETFQIDLDVANVAELEHTQVLIGASLWSASTGYIDDTPNDQAASLPPGASAVWRSFSVPPGTEQQTYDILTALWLDVDENGAISELDQPMITYNAAAALAVCSDPAPIGDSLRLVRIPPDTVELSWNGVSNATSYTVYRSSSASAGWAPIGSTTTTTLVDASATTSLRFYEVAARNACGESVF